MATTLTSTDGQVFTPQGIGRLNYFLSMFTLNFVQNAAPAFMQAEHSFALLLIFTVCLQIVLSCYRWQNIGHNAAWGLLVLLPFTALYGMLMPTNGKHTGMDRTARIVIYILLAFFIGIIVLIAID